MSWWLWVGVGAYVLAAFVVVQGFCRAAGAADRLEEQRHRELEGRVPVRITTRR